MLRDRGGAVVAEVADRDAGLPRRGEIDIVDAGRGERDQLQLRIGRDRRAVDDRLVREYRLAAGDAERDIRLRGLLVDHEARNRAFQRSGIEVAIADRAEVQEHRAHRAISRENS